MFCPRCSYQPASDNVRFCPGCGFRLDGVASLIVSDGVPAIEEPARPLKRPSMVKRGAMLGITLMLIFNMLSSLLIIRHAPQGEGLAMGSLATWVALMVLINIFGPAMRLFKKIFSETEVPEKSAASLRKPSSTPASLPPAQSLPISYEPPQRVTTSRLAAQSSVTEQTTGLLNKE